MSESLNAISKALALYRESFENSQAAARVLGGGPADFYFDKIEEYINALFNKYAPFKAGDRVALLTAPECTGHWKGSAHFLIAGAVGTVEGVDYCRNQFLADVVFDDESWIDDQGQARPKQHPHTYRLSEKILRPASPPSR